MHPWRAGDILTLNGCFPFSIGTVHFYSYLRDRLLHTGRFYTLRVLCFQRLYTSGHPDCVLLIRTYLLMFLLLLLEFRC
jgi:hypothetical protein